MNYETGAVIGDYQVMGVLGAGGMGEVYKVRNTISDRLEAMKVLLADLAQYPELGDRFLREIKVQASLKHPNIAALHTALRVDNQLLMLMEYVEGVTLEQKVRQQQGPLPVPDALSYIAQVLSALEYAHAHGVVHRDIKPANMMLMQGGIVKLMDFGIAKAASDRQLTVAGTTIGSLYYMSPEQIQGSENVDARSDLYSVGVSLYELVTGKRPFEGDSQYAIMAAHLEKAPIPPIQHDPTLPQPLNDAILMAVAKDPAARFQSAAAFRNALSRVLVPAETAPLPPPQPVPAHGNRMLWVGAGGLATAAVVIGLIQFAPWKKPEAASRPPAVTNPVVQQPQPAAVAPPPPVAETPVAEPAPVKPEPAAQKPLAKAAAPERSVAAPVRSAPPNVAPPVLPAANAVASPPQVTPQQPASQPAAIAAPQANVPTRAEMQQAREQNVMLGTRAGALRGTLQAMQRSQQSSGLNLRADMQEAASLMSSYLDGANAAIAANDLPSAKSFMDKAERQIEKLEKFLGR
jgi:eukaryotic-like serine/threonine-protein kinase